MWQPPRSEWGASYLGRWWRWGRQGGWTGGGGEEGLAWAAP